MNVNFELFDNIALKFKDRLIDLHNNFDFTGFEYKIEESVMVMNWARTNGDWIDENEFLNLVLIHRKIDYLYIMNESENGNESDAKSLAEITFYPSSDRSTNDGIVSKSFSNEDDDLLYVFENGQYIRVHCAEIELKVN